MNISKCLSILIALCICISFSSCSKDDGANFVFKYPIAENPKNLDPQLASDTASLQVVANMYECLMRKNGNSVEKAMAESYTVSNDGLTYTFNLKKDYFWTARDKDININVTAHDFVFAFTRLLDPQTCSPYAEKYFVIKNGENINKNKADKSTLGVKAISDYVLEIKLEKPQPSFLYLLAEMSSAPCNEEFFYGTMGKYGLEVESSASNGPFFLHEWLNDEYGTSNYLILRRSSPYNKINRVYPSGLNYFVTNDDNAIFENFEKETYHLKIGDGKDTKYFNKNYKQNEFKTKSTGIIINPANTIINNDEIRQALSYSIDRNLYKSKLSEGISSSGGIIPNSVSFLNKSYRELVGEPAMHQLNIELAQLLWISTLSNAEKSLLNAYTVIVPESFLYTDELELVLEQWGENLEFYCSVEILSDKDYKAKLKSGDYNLAIYTLDSNINSPYEYLNYFETDNIKNILDFKDANYDKILKNAKNSEHFNSSLEYYQEAENYIIDKNIFIPLFYQSEYIFYQKGNEGIQFDPFTKQVFLKDAKYFE